MPVTRVPVAISTPAVARAGRERHRQIGRVELAIGREVHRAEHAGRIEQAVEQLDGVLGGDQLQRQPERRRPARLPRELLEARR